MLVALVGSGFVPIAHMALFEGFKALRNFPLIHIAIMILCFLLGTIFYVTHLPEKHWPGTFDLWVSLPFLTPDLPNFNLLCCMIVTMNAS